MFNIVFSNFSCSVSFVPVSFSVPSLEVRFVKKYSTEIKNEIILSYRENQALSEYNLTFNLCLVVL